MMTKPVTPPAELVALAAAVLAGDRGRLYIAEHAGTTRVLFGTSPRAVAEKVLGRSVFYRGQCGMDETALSTLWIAPLQGEVVVTTADDR